MVKEVATPLANMIERVASSHNPSILILRYTQKPSRVIKPKSTNSLPLIIKGGSAVLIFASFTPRSGRITPRRYRTGCPVQAREDVMHTLFGSNMFHPPTKARQGIQTFQERLVHQWLAANMLKLESGGFGSRPSLGIS